MWSVTVTVTVSSDVTDLWLCDLITLTLTLSFKNRKINQKKMKWEKEIKINRVHHFQLWQLSPLMLTQYKVYLYLTLWDLSCNRKSKRK